MAWCVKNGNGRLWDHAVRDTSAAAIDFALSVFRHEPEIVWRGRLAAWNWLKRTHGLRLVRVVAVGLAVEEPCTDAQRLALCVLRGDTGAALVLADLVLETYHAARKGGG